MVWYTYLMQARKHKGGIKLSQVSLNTRISPETDKMLREWQGICKKSIASIVDDAIISHLLIVNKDLVMRHLPKEVDEE